MWLVLSAKLRVSLNRRAHLDSVDLNEFFRACAEDYVTGKIRMGIVSTSAQNQVLEIKGASV